MDHAALLAGPEKQAEMRRFTGALIEAIHAAFRENKGTRDLSGASGLTTEHFVQHVAKKMPVLLRN
jgi:isocitrate dehydrogenase